MPLDEVLLVMIEKVVTIDANLPIIYPRIIMMERGQSETHLDISSPLNVHQIQYSPGSPNFITNSQSI